MCQSVACLPLRVTGESRRVPSVLLHVQVAGTVKTDARYHKRIRHCESLIATKGRGRLSYFCHTPTTLIHLVGAKHPF